MIPKAFVYLLAAAIGIGIVTTPAILVFIFGGQSTDDALLTAFATLMLVAAIAVVTMRDIIRCGLAIIVLVLFAIMLTQTKSGPSRLVFQTQAVWAALAAAVLVIVVAVAVLGTDWPDVTGRLRASTDVLAQLLFRDYVLPFEVVSVLLLAAVIGGVFLAKREERGDTLA